MKQTRLVACLAFGSLLSPSGAAFGQGLGPDVPEVSLSAAGRVGPVECTVVEGPQEQVFECNLAEVYLLRVPNDSLRIPSENAGVQICKRTGVEVQIVNTDDGIDVSVICHYDDCGFSLLAGGVSPQ